MKQNMNGLLPGCFLQRIESIFVLYVALLVQGVIYLAPRENRHS